MRTAHKVHLKLVPILLKCEREAWLRWHREKSVGEVIEHKELHGRFPVINGGRILLPNTRGAA